MAGENCFKIRPVSGGSLKNAKVEYKSIYGKVVSEWSMDGDAMKLIIDIPSNTKAVVELPDGTTNHIKSGIYVVSVILGQNIKKDKES